MSEHKVPVGPQRGPKGYPILGVLPMLRSNALAFLEQATKEYGDFFPVRVFMSNAYVLNHPAHVEHVLQTNYRNYRKSPMLDKLKPILGEGLFLSEGELWTQQRKLIAPSFFRQRVEAMGVTMSTVASEHVWQWDKRAEAQAEFSLSEDMSFLTLEVALRTMFGNGMDESEAKAFSDALMIGNEVSAERVWNLTRLTEILPTAKNRAYDRAVQTLDRVVWRVIRERRATGVSGDDLLGVLIDARDSETHEAMNDQQLRDEVLSLLLSGHETTAVMLAWTFHFLAQHPACLEQLRSEVDTVLAGRVPTPDDLKQMDYTKRVIQEVARLRPSIWWFARVAVNDDDICGQPIKAGTTVLISQYLIHHHPSIWDDPTVFNPDRFLPEYVAKRPKFAYLPFGAGPRVCLGSGFATMEMQMVLAMLLRRFDVTITSESNPELSPMITLRPKKDITARVKPRLRH
jgi:cytochrome P450